MKNQNIIITCILLALMFSCGSRRINVSLAKKDTIKIAKTYFAGQKKESSKDKIFINKMPTYILYEYYINDKRKTNEIIKDSLVIKKLFNYEERGFYNEQGGKWSYIKNFSNKKIREKFEKEKELDKGKHLWGFEYFDMLVTEDMLKLPDSIKNFDSFRKENDLALMSSPVFSKNQRFAIFYFVSINKEPGIMIYKKEKGIWQLYKKYTDVNF